MTTTAAKKTVKKTSAAKNVAETEAAGVKANKAGTAKPAKVTKDTSKKAAAPAKAAAKKPTKTERDRASYGDKKIKGLVKSAEDAGLRPGTIRAKMLDTVLKAKNTDEILGKEVTVNGEKHSIAGNNLAGMISRGHISLS